MDSELISKARSVARSLHAGQVRKYTEEPYINHCAEVANLVHMAKGSDAMIAAAWLHDTLEDTGATIDGLLDLFPEEVVGYVDELTDTYTNEAFPMMSRRTRKQREAARLGECSRQSSVIKWCDLQSNTRTIVKYDPEFAIVYLREKADVLEAILPNLRKWGIPNVG